MNSNRLPLFVYPLMAYLDRNRLALAIHKCRKTTPFPLVIRKQEKTSRKRLGVFLYPDQVKTHCDDSIGPKAMKGQFTFKDTSQVWKLALETFEFEGVNPRSFLREIIIAKNRLELLEHFECRLSMPHFFLANHVNSGELGLATHDPYFAASISYHQKMYSFERLSSEYHDFVRKDGPIYPASVEALLNRNISIESFNETANTLLEIEKRGKPHTLFVIPEEKGNLDEESLVAMNVSLSDPSKVSLKNTRVIPVSKSWLAEDGEHLKGTSLKFEALRWQDLNVVQILAVHPKYGRSVFESMKKKHHPLFDLDEYLNRKPFVEALS